MPPEAAPLLSWGIAICILMAVVWAFRIRSKGIRGVVMMAAFLVFALMLFLLRQQSPRWAVTLAGVALFALLLGDALLRPRQGEKE